MLDHSMIYTPHLSLSCYKCYHFMIDCVIKNSLYCVQHKNDNDSPYINGLVQERLNSSALAMKLRLSCTNPPISPPLETLRDIYSVLYFCGRFEWSWSSKEVYDVSDPCLTWAQFYCGYVPAGPHDEVSDIWCGNMELFMTRKLTHLFYNMECYLFLLFATNLYN